MSSEVTIRPYLPGDEREIIELLKPAFPDWANRSNPVEYWGWKYPSDKSMTTVAEVEGKVVGARPFLLMDTLVCGSVLKGIFMDDLIVDPNYRQLGVYRKMYDYSEVWASNQRSFTFAITTNPILIQKIVEKDIMLFSQPVTHLVKIKNIQHHLKMKDVKNAAVVGSGLSVLKVLSKINADKKSRINADFSVVEAPFDFKVNDFWVKASKSYRFFVKKDLAFLNWRFSDPRSGKYVIRQAVKDDELLGFAVLELKELNGYLEGYVVDLVALPGRADVVKGLLVNSFDFFDDVGVNAVHYKTIRGHPYGEVAYGCGFIEPPKAMEMQVSVNFYMKGEEKALIRSSPPGQLYFGYGDYL